MVTPRSTQAYHPGMNVVMKMCTKRSILVANKYILTCSNKQTYNQGNTTLLQDRKGPHCLCGTALSLSFPLAPRQTAN